MDNSTTITLDGNEAAASVAHRLSEIIAIYPITPSSAMGELADEWSAAGRVNIWGDIPIVQEMQSEGGAAGVVHGAIQAGALATTFTASQGLLLMIPNMYKIAGELTPFVMHVTARTLATHALSIFGDHSDINACRQTGFAMLSSASVQEAHDMAAIAHAATLEARIPFLHFFDGFRTSHEVTKIRMLDDDDLRHMVSDELIAQHRQRALSPDHPVIRGTAQNPDTFFQAREASNHYYDACPGIVQRAMDRFGERTGRRYKLFEYHGDPRAQRVIVIMGSGAQTVQETVDWMRQHGEERIGALQVRLLRPFCVQHFINALPATVRRIAVLDRTKDAGALSDPLHADIVVALSEAKAAEGNGLKCALLHDPLVINGRYGLASKEFTPAMVKAVFDELAKPEPMRRFTVGIVDDLTHLSLRVDPEFDIEPDDVFRAVFFGLGADGTVGANKNSIKIIGEETDHQAQGYFVYDSKKSGAVTISHLRFGPRPIRSQYLIKHAHIVACHQFMFLEKHDVLGYARHDGILLLNAPFEPEHVWNQLAREVQQQIIEKRLKVYVIDAYRVAREAEMGTRINTIMQTCFFAISGVLPREEAISQIKKAIRKTYGRKGVELVTKNFAAVDLALSHLHEIPIPSTVTAERALPPIVPDDAPDRVKKVTALMLAGKGDLLPVSAFPVDGTWEPSTSRWEKRGIAMDMPVWDPALCIQCNKCAMVCPHAAIRAKFYAPETLAGAPGTFKSVEYKAPDHRGTRYTIQVAPDDCTGCNLCVMVCPAKDKIDPKHKALDMHPQAPLRQAEAKNFRFFLDLPEPDRTDLRLDVKGTQFLQPLFEFSGACAGCGETPYIKLLTQLFGDRVLIANATGCSSIYGGNLPTTPYCANKEGRGPAWCNSLFEDNAEFGLGFRLALDGHVAHARRLVQRLAPDIGEPLAAELLSANQESEAGIIEQRNRVNALRSRLQSNHSAEAGRLLLLADYLVNKSVWIVGGDGWAYDIGYGGLDHVLSTGNKVRVLVLDTEVYSNTGGQQSKATPIAAAAKFAAAGKFTPKKDLGLIAMTYGNIYVARVALGAKDVQTVKAFEEAESFPGPSLIIAYSHCIAHGYDMAKGAEQQKLAVDSGHWPLFRFDPRRREAGENPLQLDSSRPKIKVSQFAMNETRFRMVAQQDPQRFQRLMDEADRDAATRWTLYERLTQTAPETEPAKH